MSDEFLPPHGSLRAPKIPGRGRTASQSPGWSERDQDAADARERFARDLGCDSFEQAMAIGLRVLARRGEAG